MAFILLEMFLVMEAKEFVVVRMVDFLGFCRFIVGRGSHRSPSWPQKLKIL